VTADRPARGKGTYHQPEVGLPAGYVPPSAALSVERQQPLVQYPFPLRAGLDVWLRLPRVLTVGEAERLCRFVRGLAREDPS